MSNDLTKKLEKLTSCPAVSGNEVALHGHLQELVSRHAHKTWVDLKGNFIAVKGDNPTLALFAHADKIGFMVQTKGEDGKFKVVQLKKSQKTKFLPGPVGQVVVTHRGDFQPFSEGLLINESLNLEEKDLHLSPFSSEEVKVGDVVSFKPNFSVGKGIAISQGLDNKVGLLAAIEVFKKSAECILVASAQEEMSSKSVSSAVYALKPKMALVVDVTFAEGSIKAGGGPTICLKDNLIPSLKMIKLLEKAAVVKKLPFQYEVLEEGGSEAVAIENVGLGVPFAFVGVPIKHMHTPYEQLILSDLKGAIGLLSAVVEKGTTL